MVYINTFSELFIKTILIHNFKSEAHSSPREALKLSGLAKQLLGLFYALEHTSTRKRRQSFPMAGVGVLGLSGGMAGSASNENN